MTRHEAILIAKFCAARRHPEHEYLANALSDPDWMPHEWVIDAILVAGHFPRDKLAALNVPCNLMQRSDSMTCLTCGQCWDMNDPAPPLCPHSTKGPDDANKTA